MNAKDKTLIIRGTSKDLIYKLIKDRKYLIEPLYRGNKYLISRLLRKFFIKFKLPFYKLWFNQKILTYKVDTVIIFDSLLSKSFVEWISRNMNVTIHIWYWNIVKNTISPKELDDKICTKWTFSSVDAEKYNMHFNPPFFFNEIKCENQTNEYDILFVGKDKGRLSKLLSLKGKFDELGLKSKFIITKTKKYHRNKNYSKEIPYEQTFKLTCETKAILDYIEVNNSGQSMRMMESIFRSKKIITNNILVKKYDFYDKRNIFILEQDDINELKIFINTPYRKIDSKIIQRYDFDNFYNRFFEI